MKNLKTIPVFKSEKDERSFWQKHDSTEYADWSKARRQVFPRLKPTSKSISLRLPVYPAASPAYGGTGRIPPCGAPHAG